jgi:hypothetical protein
MSVISIVPFCPILRCTVSLTQNTASRASLLRPHKARKHVLVGYCQCTWETRRVQAVGGRAAKRGGSASSGQSSCSSHRLEASCVSDAAKRLHRSPDRLFRLFLCRVANGGHRCGAWDQRPFIDSRLAREAMTATYPDRSGLVRITPPPPPPPPLPSSPPTQKNHVPHAHAHAHAHAPAHCTRAVARTTAQATRSW